MKNIVLTGFMGTGKSTVGRLIARETGFAFVDTDSLIVEKSGHSIEALFAQYGEAAFRELEQQCIEAASRLCNCVIATGGGCVLNRQNIDNLRRNGIVFCLSADIATILARVGKNSGRPLLDHAGEEEAAARLAARQPYYDNCDVKVDTAQMDASQVARRILEQYRQLTGQTGSI